MHLFPLELVLLPAETLPLHIFEPRYKELIGECLEEKTPFGVVRAGDSGLAEIGCTAEILEVARRYDDGRLDIVTEGRQRFEIVAVNEERAFLRAEALFFEDESADDASAQERARALELHQELLTLAGAEASTAEASGEEDAPLLSFQLVSSLPLDLDFKQAMLGTRSEAARVKAIIEYYQAVLPKLRRTLHVRKKAGGNGHAH